MQEKRQISLCYEKIANIRKNHYLAKSISDASWYKLVRQLEYKAKWNRRKYIKEGIVKPCKQWQRETRDIFKHILVIDNNQLLSVN